HHIFPKNILKDKYDRKEINDIANLTFIGKTTNITISDQDPNVYIKKIATEKGLGILKQHCIPEDDELWHTDRFIEFTNERRKLLLELINDYLNNIK
ncbi:MAG: DUF1524 domain-containing protein, partial [Opitutales bacterium]|nr:DUF1524 domain-containing protein [Opitutales bacterium]